MFFEILIQEMKFCSGRWYLIKEAKCYLERPGKKSFVIHVIKKRNHDLEMKENGEDNRGDLFFTRSKSWIFAIVTVFDHHYVYFYPKN